MIKIDRDLRQTFERIARRRPEARAQIEKLLAGELPAADVEDLLERVGKDVGKDDRAALQRVLGRSTETSRPNLQRPAGAVSLTDLRRAEAARRGGAGQAASWWGACDAASLRATIGAGAPATVQVGDEAFTPFDVEAMLGDVGARGVPAPRHRGRRDLNDLLDE